MSCYSCGGNPSTFCRECNYPKDTWIAPVDALPDVFMGDFDHLYRTPDGNLFALSPDRTRWIQVNGSGGNATVYKAGNGIEISNGNVISNTQPNVNQNLSINGRTIAISNGNSITLPEDRDTVYNDTEIKRRVQAVEAKTDNFVSGVSVSREGNKVKLTYTFVNGAPKEVEFEDKDTITLAYDDTALKARVKALEDRPDRDTVYNDKPLRDRIALLENKEPQGLNYNPDTNELSLTNGGNSVTIPNGKQTISRQGNKLVLSNGGGEVDLPQGNSSVAYDDTSVVNRLKALEAKGDNDNQNLTINNRTISISGGNSITLPEDRDTIYNDTDIKRRLTALEGKADKDSQTLNLNPNTRVLYISNGNTVTLPNDNQSLSVNGNNLTISGGNTVTLPVQPIHRFYDGDIPGAGNPADIHTVKKSKLRNPDGIKVGDTLEDFWSDSNVISRGIWKVLEVNGDNVKVQGIGGYVTNLRKNLTLNPNTRVLSIDGGNNVTLPNDKQSLTLSGNTLSISGGNSVTIPQPNLNNYVTVQQYNELKGALEKLLQDLKNSGAWNQTGGNIFQGNLHGDRHIATGNINLFGGTVDGGAFIRTNNGRTENDLAGGIG